MFIDADKTNYLAYYEAVLPKLAPGGLIAADNTLWSGRVVDDADQSDDTRAIRAFNDAVVGDPRVGVRAGHGARRRHAHPPGGPHRRPAAGEPSARSPARSMLDYHLHLVAPRPARHRAHARAGGRATATVPERRASRRSRSPSISSGSARPTGCSRGFWDDEPDAALRASMANYWDDHARADLDAYVECVLAAKDAGLPVVLGLEVDYYRGRMDDVVALLGRVPLRRLVGIGPLDRGVALRRHR